MGTGMLATNPLAPILIEDGVSIARLHGEACFDCGAVTKKLLMAGHGTLRGNSRVWQIMTCGCRVNAVAA